MRNSREAHLEKLHLRDKIYSILKGKKSFLVSLGLLRNGVSYSENFTHRHDVIQSILNIVPIRPQIQVVFIIPYQQY